MCGRFTQRYSWSEIHDLYGLAGPARNLQPHYNIAPTDPVDVSSLSMAALERLRAGGKSLPKLGVRWLTMPPDRRTIGPDHRLGSIGDRLQLCTSPAYSAPLSAGFFSGVSGCGSLGATPIPNWIERRDSLSGTRRS